MYPPNIERMSKFYDPSSFAALASIVTGNGGDVVASFQLAFITDRPRSDGLRLDRQHVMSTGSNTLLVERAYDATSSNGLHRKVYWNALVPTADGIRVDTLDRHRDGHYVWTWDVTSYGWLTTSSFVAAAV